MAHNPVNHPARPLYRTIGGLAGIYLVVFGVLGAIQDNGGDAFAQDDSIRVFGQGTNMGGSIILAVLGLIVLIGSVVGRNVDVAINRWFAYLFMVIGLGSLAVLRTDANYLNFSVVTCAVTMIIGLVLLMVGMYGRVGTEEEHNAWRNGRLVL